MKDYIFALDIGTRTVVGLFCRVNTTAQLVVEHYLVESHPRRAMLDGQIHDVAQVSSIVMRIRRRMEELTGLSLGEVAIAAAGRALSTWRTEAELEFPTSKEITLQDIEQLEVHALTRAREEINQDSLYCVGISPLGYKLNGFEINNLMGQRGKTIGVEIIATFLPQVVVDSLFGALAKAGLEVSMMTLEPIAAMAAAVPSDLRSLNLALIDIGAGTSDIAISRQGAIVAYDMVDMAGDEITEVIAQHYLLDFNTAETVKLSLNDNDHLEFSDVLGNKHSQSREQILQLLEPVVDKLAAKLTKMVQENNGGSPAAVFCVGGGSLTPMLRERLALHLDLPQDKIGSRTGEHIQDVSAHPQLHGPDTITPLGIALIALRPHAEKFIQVWVNGQSVTLFNAQRATVAQALLHNGADVQHRHLQYVLNGEPRMLARDSEQQIQVNEVAATLDTQLNSGDRIEVRLGDGKPMSVSLAELTPAMPDIQVKVDGKDTPLPSVRLVNSQPAAEDTIIKAGDVVDINAPATVGELAKLMDLDPAGIIIKVDGIKTQPCQPLPQQGCIEFEKEEQGNQNQLTVTFNGSPLVLTGENTLANALAQAGINNLDNLVLTVNGNRAEPEQALASGDSVKLYWGKDSDRI